MYTVFSESLLYQQLVCVWWNVTLKSWEQALPLKQVLAQWLYPMEW